MIIKTKYGDIKIFAKTLEEQAYSQIIQLANSPLGENANMRIMPDAHAGAGCVIGTTMVITDKVCSDIVGVDIGCGVDLISTDLEFSDILCELDEVIRKYVPNGYNHQQKEFKYDFTKLKCWDKLKDDVKKLSQYSLGTLGGGNHFIEAYNGGRIAVHSGSRNIGYNVAKCYDGVLYGDKMKDYLHDVAIMTEFARKNREVILSTIVNKLGGHIIDKVTSTHNYIDVNNMILRKGAISAQKGESLVIPLNMRDGLLLCKGKGNKDWNYSAPHGAGRLYSRRKSKELFDLDDFKETMNGVYSTSISEHTIDESPFAYKDYKEIMECIEPTVDIIERLIPIYNFKAS